MNKEWSELNKIMQAQIKKKDTYKMGIDTLPVSYTHLDVYKRQATGYSFIENVTGNSRC